MPDRRIWSASPSYFCACYRQTIHRRAQSASTLTARFRKLAPQKAAHLLPAPYATVPKSRDRTTHDTS
ncbi:hypothetical protein [Acetobacter orleanensis]|uniref:hypothetical protein n=1 Tax=Acetobacter orleanensis TaxID=104099 RepID=UPI000B333AF0|nr:hypothetical protein [Acetobacter orleanensis]